MTHEKKSDDELKSEYRPRDLLIRAVIIALIMISLCVVLALLDVWLELIPMGF